MDKIVLPLDFNLSEIKAVILVGGYGTRLRPLTLTRAKPLIEFVNKPILLHQIEALAKTGITDVSLAVSYKADDIETELKDLASNLGVSLTFSLEKEPLGTAGPLALLRDKLQNNRNPFLVLNSDVICEFPFKELLLYHKQHGKEGTIFVNKVSEPWKYGVVGIKEGLIESFIEKPVETTSDKINSGIYAFSPSILNRIELRPMSFEKDVFPSMVKERQLQAMELKGFWMDIGQPRDFLFGTSLYLKYQRRINPNALCSNVNSAKIIGNVVIHPSAVIGEACCIGPDVSIGPLVILSNGVRVKHSTIFQGALIKQQAWISNSLIGWRSEVGAWSRVENSILSECVKVQDEVYMDGVQVLPHKSVSNSLFQSTIVI